jgi:hypothetical protein
MARREARRLGAAARRAARRCGSSNSVLLLRGCPAGSAAARRRVGAGRLEAPRTTPRSTSPRSTSPSSTSRAGVAVQLAVARPEEELRHLMAVVQVRWPLPSYFVSTRQPRFKVLAIVLWSSLCFALLLSYEPLVLRAVVVILRDPF